MIRELTVDVLVVLLRSGRWLLHLYQFYCFRIIVLQIRALIIRSITYNLPDPQKNRDLTYGRHSTGRYRKGLKCLNEIWLDMPAVSHPNITRTELSSIV